LVVDDCPAKYTKDHWKQHYKGTRCVEMKDGELTREVLEDMSKQQLQAVSVSRSIRLASGPIMFQDGKRIEGQPKQRVFNNLMMFLTNPQNGKDESGYISSSSSSYLKCALTRPSFSLSRSLSG